MLSKEEEFYFINEFPKIRDEWLEKVSRTFTLSIRVLPKNLCEYVGHAYLICRFLDSLEDAEFIGLKKKQEALNLALFIMEKQSITLKEKEYFCNFSKLQEFPEYEGKLLCNADLLINGLMIFPKDIRSSIIKWASEMGRGMIEYAFGVDSLEPLAFNNSDLEKYTYYVAGTVGLMLSEIFTSYGKNISSSSKKTMKNRSIGFGKALQFVNIIKDSRSDYKEGRCFIPDDLLSEFHLTKEEFFQKDGNNDKVIALYNLLFDKAKTYLTEAIEYIMAIPIKYWRIRLFCIWPIILAIKTLDGISLDVSGFIQGSSKFKITRSSVKKAVYFSYPAGFSNTYFKIILKKNNWKFL